jgi:hypothetical protein
MPSSCHAFSALALVLPQRWRLQSLNHDGKDMASVLHALSSTSV